MRLSIFTLLIAASHLFAAPQPSSPLVSTTVTKGEAFSWQPPLAEGNCWKTDVFVRLPNGQSLTGVGTQITKGTKVIRGNTYLVTKTTVEGIPKWPTLTFFHRETADGIYAISEADPKLQEYRDGPANGNYSVGSTWQIPGQDGLLTMRVEGVESVTLGAKTYSKCLKISCKSETGAIEGVSYAAPGIGSIKEVVKAGGGTIEIRLRSFTPNSK